MKSNLFSSIAFISFICLSSCVKTKSPIDNVPKPGVVKVFFNSLANGNTIELGKTPNYTNNLGQKFSVNILKYYISQIRLKDDKGNEINLGNYTLINEDVDAPKRVESATNFPAGNYTSVTFNFGLDKQTNGLPLATGDLDHSYGMWWGEAKYLFLKHEGDFINNANVKNSLIYHVGTDESYVSNITIPISGLTINNNTKTVVINFNFEKMYDNIDFNLLSNMMSNPVSDKEIISTITTNIKTAFSFNSIQ
jgi:hypothetical protein